jgi:hypothetical protein
LARPGVRDGTTPSPHQVIDIVGEFARPSRQLSFPSETPCNSLKTKG